MCEFSKVCIFYFEIIKFKDKLKDKLKTKRQFKDKLSLQVKDNYLDVGKLFHITRLRFNFFIFDGVFSLTYGTLPIVY